MPAFFWEQEEKRASPHCCGLIIGSTCFEWLELELLVPRIPFGYSVKGVEKKQGLGADMGPV